MSEVLRESSSSLWKDAWIRLCRNQMAIFGGAVLLFLGVLSLFAPWLAPYKYETQNLELGAVGPQFTWEPHQLVFGTCTQERALVLAKGYDTVYQPFANALTIVPDSMSGFINQQSRWRKGYLYEAIMASTHMWKRPIGAVVLFYLSLLMLVMGPLVMIYFLVLSTLLVGTMPTLSLIHI